MTIRFHSLLTKILSILVFFLLLPQIEILASVDEVAFQLVTSESQIHDGDEVIIVSREGGVSLSNTSKGSYVLTCNVRLSSDGLQAYVTDQQTAVFTMQKSATKWRFYNDEKGWLWASDKGNYELSYAKNSPSNKSNNTQLSINSDGNATIEFDVKNYKYLKYNGATHFACYLYATSQSPVQIYRRQRHVADVVLSEDMNNASLIKESVGGIADNVVVERRFSADGGYYTLCLPFALTAADMEESFSGASFYEFARVEQKSENDVIFHFKRVMSTKAGMPYLLLVESDVDNPAFHNKLIDVEKPSSQAYTLQGLRYSFCGTLDPVTLEANGSTRFVSSDGRRLVTPNSVGDLKALRCYFSMPRVETGACFDDDKSVSYAVCVDEDTADIGLTTSLHTIDDDEKQKNTANRRSTYDLSGRRLQNTFRGIKIINGRKVIERRKNQ